MNRDGAGPALHMPAALIQSAQQSLLVERAVLERAVIDAAPDGIMLVGRDGRILMANQAMEAIAGYTKAQLVGQSIQMLLPPHLRGKHAEQMQGFFAQPSRRPMGAVGHLHIFHVDGSHVPVDIALGHCHMGDDPCAVVFVRDISGVRRLEEQMQYQATHDALTGLANRWQFMQQLMYTMAQAARRQRGMALLLLDLDDFKAINDGHGHAAGDAVLVETARRIRGVLRAEDLLARLGGDEFTVLLPEISHPSDVDLVVQKLLLALAEPIRVHDYEVHPGASIGVACFPTDAGDSDTLLRYADMAMYQAKAAGRNTYAVYRAEMGHRLEERLTVHDRLKQALKDGHLRLHYQPQVDVRTGRVLSVEALLRWTDPVLGEVPPDRFIPVAESTGLILPLGEWVLETACRQQAAWAAKGLPMQVAINLSVRQFRQPQLCERLAALLRQTGVRPGHIELEITESEAMAEPEHAASLLAELAALGVRLALDDFGTGHSSLSYLKVLPIQRIKIDREFVRHVPRQKGDANLVRAVIALAHTLGLEVVAEGVESQEQLDFLQANRCQVYQGWLTAKAMPADELEAWLHRRAPARPPCAASAFQAIAG
jgi:diguanylate cyclase (GGDEF)-like protein/PAS domain S-box-containing protein